jgi:hypothetical protein
MTDSGHARCICDFHGYALTPNCVTAYPTSALDKEGSNTVMIGDKTVRYGCEYDKMQHRH